MLLTKVVRLTSNIPQTGARSVTVSQVLGSLFGANTGVFLRFKKISVWSQSYSTNGVIGSDSETLTLTIPGYGTAGAIPGGDGALFSDNGVYGRRRPQLHITPPLLVQQFWINAGAVDAPDLFAILNMQGDDVAGTAVIIHVTVELRFPAVVA